MAGTTPLQYKVLPFYIKDLESDFYRCKLCPSNKPISGKKPSNLVSHVRTCHPEKLTSSSERDSDFRKKRLKIIQSLSEIVSVNGRPFNSLLDSGLLNLIKPDLERLDNAGHGINLNKNLTEIKDHVKHIAYEIRKSISSEVENQVLSLLLDIGSKNRQSILGIGIQFMHDDVVYNKSIGMIPLKKSHTADYIVQELKECLKLYHIEINQIIAMVSDNASNMLAATKRLDQSINKGAENEDNILNASEFNNNGLERHEILNNIMEMQELDSILCDDENFEQLFVEVIGELSKHTTSVITIRCAAHSVQLCVRGALKKSDFHPILSLCKYVVHKLHTQKYKYEIHEANIKCISPHTSNDTRWDSDLQMVSLN